MNEETRLHRAGSEDLAGGLISSQDNASGEISRESRSAFQPMPPLSVEVFDALREDIRVNGIITPVVQDQHGRILDGNNRVQIASELGIDYPVVVQHVESDDDAEDRAVFLNCARRHLTREQQREVIRQQIERHPERSDRAIARLIGCSHRTVASVRRPEPEVGKLSTWRPPSDVDPSDIEIAHNLYARTNLGADLPQTDADYEWAQTAILYDADNPLWFNVAIAMGAGRAELVAAVVGRMSLWKARGMDRALIRRLFDDWLYIAMSDQACDEIAEEFADFVASGVGDVEWLELVLSMAGSVPRYPSEIGGDDL